MKVTYLGTTVLLFDNGTDRVMFDCHFTRPSIHEFIFGKLRTDRETADRVIRDYDLKSIKAIFISHSHHDHVMDLPYTASVSGCDVYGTESTLNVARGGNVSEEQLHVFRGGETFTVGSFEITVLPSKHSKPNFFNNDLGMTIDQPLVQPAKRKEYREGGSYDFLVSCDGRRYLIRPSYNYVEGELNDIRADILFAGIAGISKDNEENKRKFIAETIDKVDPRIVIPLHWDNFFTPLYGPLRGMPRLFEDTGKSLSELAGICAGKGIECLLQLPLTTVEL